MRRVTLVGEPWARVGARFLNDRPCEVAPLCPIAKACQNLPWDREFEVTAVRPVHHSACLIHEGGVRVVEVEELPLAATLDASKTRGTAVRWQPPVCHIRGCPNWDRCFPHGPRPGEEYVLEQVGERIDCPMGYALVAVGLRSTRPNPVPAKA